jgi:biotin operon repressor
MVKGVALIEWDVVEGGKLSMKYPKDLVVPENIVQQIQLAHNFSNSYIITEEQNWNSISFYNEDEETIVLLVLGKYDDGSDYISVLDEFNKEIETGVKGEKLKAQLKKIYTHSLDVFRTRDEVVSKLCEDLSSTKTELFKLEQKLDHLFASDVFQLRDKILLLFAQRDYISVEELCRVLGDVKEKKVRKIIKKLQKKSLLVHDDDQDVYKLKF